MMECKNPITDIGFSKNGYTFAATDNNKPEKRYTP